MIDEELPGLEHYEPYCRKCDNHGHDTSDCTVEYVCPGSFALGSFNAVGVLECPHCHAQFIGTSVPQHEEE